MIDDDSGTCNGARNDSDEDLLSQFPPLVRFDQDRESLRVLTEGK